MIKLEFIKSLYPYKKGDIVDFNLNKYTDLVRKYTREVDQDQDQNQDKDQDQNQDQNQDKDQVIKKVKNKNKAILNSN